MNRTRWMTVAMAMMLMTLLTGCGGQDTPESLVKETIGTMKELNKVLASITDEASAKAAAPKIERLAARMESIEKRAEEFTDAEMRAAGESYEDEMGVIGSELFGNVMRLGFRQDLHEHLDEAMGKLNFN